MVSLTGSIPAYSQFIGPDSKSYLVQTDFNGTYTNTAWNATANGVNLTGTNLSGQYTSQIYNAGEVVDWTNISFLPDRVYGQQLPDNGVSNDTFNMTGNTGLFHFNEISGSTTWTDSSGQNNNGTCGPSCPLVSPDGVFGNAISFDQTGSAYLLPSSLTVRGLATVSFGVWIKPSQVNNSRVIYEESVSGSNTNERFSWRIESGFLRLYGRWDDLAINPQFDVTGTTAIVANQWQHIGVVYNANTGTISLYVNGVGQTFSRTLSPFANTPSRNPAVIGQTAGTGNSKYVGLMDEFTTFNRPLAPTEFTTLAASVTGDVNMQVRACANSTCTGASFVGPAGTTATTDVFKVSTLPTISTLSQTFFANTQYIQFRFNFTRTSATNTDINPTLKQATINFLRPSAATLSFGIRSEDGTTNTNICNFGEVTTGAVSICRYRLWINTNASLGYSVFVRTDGDLKNGSFTIANAATGTSGGTNISNATAGTEAYGIIVYPGTNGTNSLVTASAYSGGANSVALNNTTNQLLVSSTAPNTAAQTSTTQTILMEHRLNISGDTRPGTYSQRVTFSIVPNF